MSPSESFWSGKKILLTGHTGFKGSWMTCWLLMLGADVTGFSLPDETDKKLFADLNFDDYGFTDLRGDIRDRHQLEQAIIQSKPDIVIHMAAQSLVRESYDKPLETFEANVMGTANILDVIRDIETVQILLSVTSDKCYENKEWVWPYRETDPLGGHDPYSASKACAEIVTASYRRSFFGTDKNPKAIASARAGNVIGGGDFSKDRIIVDLVNAALNNEIVSIRNPLATRPWQHVLECICGYLTLCEKLWDNPDKFSDSWNFGPGPANVKTVKDLAESFTALWPDKVDIQFPENDGPHEANLLMLDASKSKTYLGWSTRLSFEDTMAWTVDWYRAFSQDSDKARKITQMQIQEFTARCE